MIEEIQRFIDLANEPGLQLNLANLERVQQALSQLPQLEASLPQIEQAQRGKLRKKLQSASRQLRTAEAVLSGKEGFYPSWEEDYYEERHRIHAKSLVEDRIF